MESRDAMHIIEQITQHKLEFTRSLLKDLGLPYSGTRDELRSTFDGALDNGLLSIDELRTYLEPLELWGNQRIRVVRLPADMLAGFQHDAEIRQRLKDAQIEDLWEQEIPLVIPAELTPLSIRVSEVNGQRTLLLIAGRIRETWIPQPGLATISTDEHPGVVYRPFKREIQKALSFAEINLSSGNALISTSISKNATSGYAGEFNELYGCFHSLVDLSAGTRPTLYTAVRKLYSINGAEVLIHDHRNRSSIGGVASFRSHNRSFDVRNDPDLRTASQSLGTVADGDYCNCYWQPISPLTETVHTALYGRDGDVAIYRQVREESVRHVLQRIAYLNQ